MEEGKIAWDAPVVSYLPAFQMFDPFVTRELTVRDLLVHRSGLGLGAGDLLWWPPTTYDRKEIARRLRFIRPATSFRSAYAGDIEIGFQDGKLVLSFIPTPSMVGDLEHWSYDTFLVRWRDRELRADATLTFALNPDGTIDQAKMAPLSPETDFSFDFQDLLLRPVRKKNN